VRVPAPSEKACATTAAATLFGPGTDPVHRPALAAALHGLSAWLRSLASQLARGRFYPTLAIYFVLLSLLLFVVELPLSYYIGFAREHAYGLSSQRFPSGPMIK